ncbi:hypothetical protein LEN26_018628 [Aphanomyces euteiches]|nr:hypothetical protein LEN26_018628 [Aphanomyces euteiches]KAH9104181.1 hypothetical protein AeMF1_019659 [Aphanomyces euteiches]KAH9193633.1 hypothetical protein AeNC1_004407 [Aphanomyces euteiches]
MTTTKAGRELRKLVTPRVIASLEALQRLPPTKALKFRWKEKIDGFVFLASDNTPHAYANLCSHVAVEMDLNDGDFFSNHGVIQCKVHGAMFDPESGLCLRPPPQCKLLHPLRRIPVVVESGNVLLTNTSSIDTSKYDEDYRRQKQRELHEKLNADADAIQKEIEAINQRSLRLIQSRNAPKDA